MAQSLQSISDAVIAKIVALDEFDSQSASEFNGSIEAYVDAGTPAIPFCGVLLSFGSLSEDSYSTDYKNPRENLNILLLVLSEDFRSQGYSMETDYDPIDALIDGLNGVDLGLSGVAPLRVNSWARVRRLADQGLAVHEIRLSTWQVR